MFFDSIEEIPEIAKKTGFSIFQLKNIEKINFKFPFELCPVKEENKKKEAISIDMVRVFCERTNSKETDDKFFIIYQPEKMTQEATNAFLKNLEEPKEKHHFVFITKNISELLPTILSRAQIYIERIDNPLEGKIDADEKVKTFAKRLMVASDADLPKLMKEITTKTEREFVLEVVATAIEMSYKTFFLTKDQRFIKKLPNLLKLYDNISANGNIKLHLVADMI